MYCFKMTEFSCHRDIFFNVKLRPVTSS